jgi:hypothetical protein
MDECTVTNYDVTLRLLYRCNPKTTTLKIAYFLTAIKALKGVVDKT